MHFGVLLWQLLSKDPGSTRAFEAAFGPAVGLELAERELAKRDPRRRHFACLGLLLLPPAVPAMATCLPRSTVSLLTKNELSVMGRLGILTLVSSGLRQRAEGFLAWGFL
jgi:hypothetical protein